MTCQDCERPGRDVIDFLVATPVKTGRDPRVEFVSGVLCLACFDERAKEAETNYRESLSITVCGINGWLGRREARVAESKRIAREAVLA